MPAPDVHVVTGAFGYSGRQIALRLLEAGHAVRTLTNSRCRPPEVAGRVDVRPLDFFDAAGLVDALSGAVALYNTYWVRFNHSAFTHAAAVENTRRLFGAAASAGVGRVVHVSITNPSSGSPFEYFRGKASLEQALQETGLPHSILRPAVLFGRDDILVNNIAWALRRLPVFGVFGDGSYGIDPIHVDNLADLAVLEGTASGDRVVDAVGPERFTYRELVRAVADAIGVRRPVVSVAPWLGHCAARAIGAATRDVLLTRDEIGGLMAGLLHTDSPPVGTTRLTDWARAGAHELGRRYHSELARRR